MTCKTQAWTALHLSSKRSKTFNTGNRRDLGTTSSIPAVTSLGRQKERRKGTENLFEEIMTKRYPTLLKGTDGQVQGAHSPNQDGPKEAQPRRILTKMKRES